MIERNRLPILALLLSVACGGPAGDGSADAPAADSGLAAPRIPPADAPPVLDSAGAAGPEGALAVLREYYDAVQAGDYARAYRLWSGEGEASGQTLEEFRTGYADTRTVSLAAKDPGRIEGAAGSRYIEVPVTVSAETTSGTRQCFSGTYVLRRSEVPGATEDQRAWRIHSAALDEVESADCRSVAPVSAADSALSVIRSFGRQLVSVSILGPPDVLRRDIRDRYGPLVTPELLDAWLQDPSSAPGRDVSSPWPDRIEIDSIAPTGTSRFRAAGTIVYVSSTEAGTDAAAARRPVVIEVERTADGYRLSRFEAEPERNQ